MPLLHMETDQVRSVAQSYGQYAGNIEQTTVALRQSAANLSSAWQGPSAAQFDEELKPLLQTLDRLAVDGQQLDQRLLQEVDEWELVDSRFGDGAAVPGGGLIGGPVMPTPSVPQASLTSDVDPLADLPSLMNYEPDYPPDLGPAMSEMQDHFADCVRSASGDCPDTDMYARLAELTGLSESEVEDQYMRAVEAAQKAGLGDDNPAFGDLSFLNRDHWGSRRQLMFGHVVGEHLGIHPVFAAFLNPSGGLIGPGGSLPTAFLDDNLAGFLDENAMDYHGAAHDAYGYLRNHHHTGPGYQYIDSPLNGLDPRGTNSPLSGQISGYVYWARQVGVAETVIEATVRRMAQTIPGYNVGNLIL